MLILSLVYLGGGMEFLEGRMFDFRFGLTQRPASSEVLIVAIDNGSLNEVGVWPWPRSVYARVLDKIRESGARTVALNIDLSATSNAIGDGALEEALARANGRTILPTFVQRENGAATYTVPLARFSRHAVLASANLLPASDGIVREARRETFWRETATPSLAAKLAGPGAAAPARFHIDFAIAGEDIPRLSFADILNDHFDPAAISGKAVIIGATAGQIARNFPSPQGAAVPASVLHALAVESLLGDRALWRTPPIVGLVGIFLILFLHSPFYGRRPFRKSLATAATLGASLFAIALGIQVLSPVLVDLMPWLAAVIVALGFCMTGLLNSQNLRLLAQNMIIGRKEAYVRGLVDTAFDGVIVVDEGGMIRSVNRRATEMLDNASSALVGRAFNDFLDPAAHATFINLLKNQETRDSPVELRILRGGEFFIAKLAATPVPGEDGQKMLALLLMDITSLRKAESVVADTTQRLSESLEAISEGIALWDSDDRLLTCNARFVELHAAVAHALTPGYRFEDFVRDSIMFGTPPEARGRERDWIAERLDRHRRPGTRFLQQSTDGQWLKTIERRTAKGEIICVESDVTEDQRQLQDLAAARDVAEATSKAKSRLLAHMNHELRTPLNAIIGFSEIMRNTPSEDTPIERFRDYAADIHESGKFLLKTVDDLLELTGVELLKDGLDEERIEPYRLIEDCCAAGRSGTAGGNRRILVAMDRSLPDFMANRQLISRSLTRVIWNALSSTGTNGEITVNAALDDGGNIRLQVSGKARNNRKRAAAGKAVRPDGLAGWTTGEPGFALALAELEIRTAGCRMEIDDKPRHGTTVTVIVPGERLLQEPQTSTLTET